MNQEEEHDIDWNKTKADCENLLQSEREPRVIDFLNYRIKACDRLLPKDK